MEEKKTRVKKPIFKKWWFWVIIVIIVIGAIGSNGSKDKDVQQASGSKQEDKKQAEKKEEIIETIEISADDLYSAYKENEVAADQKYKNKMLEISGTVNSIGKDITDTIYITLETGELLNSVQCYFKNSEADAVASLSKGQEITVIGKCTGLTLTNVMIKESKIK